MDLDDEQSRVTQALHENLHRLQFFMQDMTQPQRDAACLSAIKTAIDQVGEDVVRQTMQHIDAGLRQRIGTIWN